LFVALPVAELKRLVEQLRGEMERLSARDPERLQQVEDYATTQNCRVQTLLRAFDDSSTTEACGRCDVCLPEAPLRSGELTSSAEAAAELNVLTMDPSIETRSLRRRPSARSEAASAEKVDIADNLTEKRFDVDDEALLDQA
jgi:superfamily II DNA helicase RecQ